MASTFCNFWIIGVVDGQEDVSGVCEVGKSFLRDDLVLGTAPFPKQTYLYGRRIGSLHQHHGHRWSEQDDIRVFVRCDEFMLQVSRRRLPSAPYMFNIAIASFPKLTYSSQNAII